MKMKNYDSFFKVALLLSGDIRLNPGPTFDVCFVCKRTFNKRRFYCSKCDLGAHIKCNNTVFFCNDICSDCKRWENLSFHNFSFCINNSTNTESSLLEDNLPLIPSHNEAWKVFKDNSMHFRHLNVNSLLSKIEELRTPTINTNISVLGITETKLDNIAGNEELKIDGCNLLRSDRKKNSGGVTCYIKNNIAHNRQSSISENIENIFLDILLPKSKLITVGIIYRPPNQVDFIDHFNNALGKLPFQSNEIYLLGYFNINLFLKVIMS